MFTRFDMIGINYITARREAGMDDMFIYVNNKPGEDYYEFHNLLGGTDYIFRMFLPESFPYDTPNLLLVSPKDLPGYQNDKPLSQIGCSHNFHLNGKIDDGISICYNSSSWKPDSCISLLVLKAILWCDAYNKYLKDGKSIDMHLSEIRGQINE
ncbi:MAG: hypothetical protein DRP56_00665 [Planctomycetota bacterium]|nr:MAG: hypothetical protein DRP56_00665 [Planctomycetota bacterium]